LSYIHTELEELFARIESGRLKCGVVARRYGSDDGDASDKKQVRGKHHAKIDQGGVEVEDKYTRQYT
jgi:hypothetical protein